MMTGDIIEPAADHSAPKRAILVVEDDFLIRLTLSELLADEGYDVLEAETGSEALQIFADRADIAVMLTDIQLPGGLNGLDVVNRARQTRPGLPVIFMTGAPDPLSSRTDATTLMLAKPYMAADVCSAIRRLLQPAS